jgi:hypothetical protein
MAGQTGNAGMGSRTKGWRELESRMALVGGCGTLLTLIAFVRVDSRRIDSALSAKVFLKMFKLV